MFSTRHFAVLALLLAVGSANEAGILKRSKLLDKRQCSTPGWIPACPGFFSCVPPGAICCSDGFTYVMPPDTCPDGTQPLATAITSSSVPATITTPPVSTQTALPFTYFTFTITWYYWYYYFTYIQVDAATVTTSYQMTTYTTVSVQATDETEATSLFHTLSATLALPTPTQAVTSFSGSAGPTATPMSSTTPSSSTASTPVRTTSTTAAAAANTTTAQFTGAAASFRAGSMTQSFGMGWLMSALAIIPGILMFLL